METTMWEREGMTTLLSLGRESFAQCTLTC